MTGTIDLPGDSPEGLAFATKGNRLFQAMKTASTMAVVDLTSLKVTASWPTEPAKNPHGIAVVAEADALLISGGNGKLVLMSQADGKVLGSVAIPTGVDQIAYDPGLHRIYCASGGTGKIAILGLADTKLSPLGEVASSAGAHSVTVDPATHTVWTAYAKGEASFVQSFTAAP